MATVPMAKIVLKNTTKMSLNERFTAYRQQAQTALNTIRQKMQTQKQASVENRRLAQQMANRPSVIAALRLKKRSLQQRLGQKRNTTTVASPKTNVKARLSLGVGQNVIPVQNRLGTQRSNRNRGVSSPRRGGRRSNRGAPFRPGTSPMLRARLGTQNQAKYSYGSSYRASQSRGVSGNYQGGRGSYNRSRQPRNSSRNQFRKNAVGNRSQSRGAGWNRGGMSRKSIPTKQELDNQLDEYMAETKSHLDAQIDQYMAQAE